MKIAIDARPLSHDLTGIGRYTLNVLEQIFMLNKDIEWFLYSDRPLLKDFQYNNVTVKTGKKGVALTSTLFSQIIFPYWAIKDNINTFWSPRHHLPLALKWNDNIKKVVTIHDLVWKRHPETMSRFGLVLERLLFKPSVMLADNIITVSTFTEVELCNEYFTATKKTTTIPLQSFILKNKEQEQEQGQMFEPYILFVGTLEPRKNLGNLLKAFKNIQIHNHDLRLIIVGKDGWGDMQISLLTKNLGIEDKVKVTGFIHDDELLQLYQHCALLVMPSIYEGFGLPALEALSINKKVVVSKFNAIAEITGDNVFITDLDAESISISIQKALLSEPKNFADVGSDWNQVAKATLTVLTANNTEA